MLVQNFAEISYNRHQAHYDDGLHSLVERSRTDTVDYWRHARQLATLTPLLKAYPGARWLTVGDGLFGADARYLHERGANATATDVSDANLKIAFEAGYIPAYSAENAENLSFADEYFNFSLCKQAYHHFPRPMLALYELLRVTKNAVALIEPLDSYIVTPQNLGLGRALSGAWLAFKNEIKKIIGRPLYYEYGVYEPVGNYAYAVSEREMEKVALGLNFPAIAFKGLADRYLEGVETEPANESSKLFKQIKSEIEKDEKRARAGRGSYNTLITLIFKQTPPPALVAELTNAGYDYRVLSRNPYI